MLAEDFGGKFFGVDFPTLPVMPSPDMKTAAPVSSNLL
jgi:hypothetical protein